MSVWGPLLLAAAALHAGFQITVTVLVYPALVHVPADRWAEAHSRHSRTIAPVVAMVYAAMLVACVAATVTSPGPGTLVADVGTSVALLVTATLAAPTHSRLAAGPDPALLHRLIVADRLRCAGALVAAAGALAVVLPGPT